MAADPSGTRAAYASMRIVRASELLPMPWKNGGGTTREIAVHPAQAGYADFIWRASMADVERSGQFSRFAGVDRTLVMLSGAGMRLVDERGMVQAALTVPLSCARFPGELALEAMLADGPTRDFNMMVRRGAASSAFEFWRGSGVHVLDADTMLVFCAQGVMEVRLPGAAPAKLGTFDTLVIDAPAVLPCVLAGEGVAIAVGLSRLDDGS